MAACTSSTALAEANHLIAVGEPSNEVEVVVGGRRGRKRIRNPANWTKKHVKKTGLRQNAPQLGVNDLIQRHCCKKVCIQQLTLEYAASLRERFSTLTYEEQNLYLSGMVVKKETKKSAGHARKESPTVGKNGKRVGRPRAEESSFSVEYQIQNHKGLRQKVCQKAFIMIHGFGKRRLEILRKKMGTGSIIPEPDYRGKHTSRPKKVPEEMCQKVREHIMSFPTRQSHYSRHKNSNRLYLSPSLSIEKMYQQFLAKYDPEYVDCMKKKRQQLIDHNPCTVNDGSDEIKPIITKHFYNDIFSNEFNLHFGYPRSDTCSTCDSLQLQIEGTADNVEEKEKLEAELKKHHTLADEGYAALKSDCQLSKDSWSKLN